MSSKMQPKTDANDYQSPIISEQIENAQKSNKIFQMQVFNNQHYDQDPEILNEHQKQQIQIEAEKEKQHQQVDIQFIKDKVPQMIQFLEYAIYDNQQLDQKQIQFLSKVVEFNQRIREFQDIPQESQPILQKLDQMVRQVNEMQKSILQNQQQSIQQQKYQWKQQTQKIGQKIQSIQQQVKIVFQQQIQVFRDNMKNQKDYVNNLIQGLEKQLDNISANIKEIQKRQLDSLKKVYQNMKNNQKVELQVDQQNAVNGSKTNDTNGFQIGKDSSAMQNQQILNDYLSSTFRFKQQNRIGGRLKAKKTKEKIEDDNDVSYLKSQLQNQYQDQLKKDNSNDNDNQQENWDTKLQKLQVQIEKQKTKNDFIILQQNLIDQKLNQQLVEQILEKSEQIVNRLSAGEQTPQFEKFKTEYLEKVRPDQNLDDQTYKRLLEQISYYNFLIQKKLEDQESEI